MNAPISWSLVFTQIVASLITALLASVLTTYLNNRFQYLREEKRWHKEKLFEAYNQCIFKAVSSAHSARMSRNADQFLSRTNAIVELLASLNTLVVLCSYGQQESIVVIRNEVEQLLQKGSDFLLNIEPEPLESIRNKLIQLMQDDPKLKELGK